MANQKVDKPTRECDHTSKRGIPYWFEPEWCRDLNGTICRIRPIKENGTVNLYMQNKNGGLTYIQGSIQQEFKKWHTDRSIDYMLIGIDPDEILKVEE